MKKRNSFLITIISFIIILTIFGGDYATSIYYERQPFFSIKKRLEYENGDGYIYKSLFFNYYKCDDGKFFITNKKKRYI